MVWYISRIDIINLLPFRLRLVDILPLAAYFVISQRKTILKSVFLLLQKLLSWTVFRVDGPLLNVPTGINIVNHI